jgi:hypothetical protein
MRMADKLKSVLTKDMEQHTKSNQQSEKPITYNDKIDPDNGDDDKKVDCLVNTPASELEPANDQIDDAYAYNENNEH